MIDIFDKKKIDKEFIVCHSGGAVGSDSFWESEGAKYGIKTKAYSYKTKIHNSINKVEISRDDYLEGINEVKLANRVLCRYGIDKYMNLLARNWAQVKYSDKLFAIGYIINPGEKNKRGYYNKSEFQSIDGGTAYAFRMAINNNKPVYVFDQGSNSWFRWSYVSMSFIKTDTPIIDCLNFAGIGTRELSELGMDAIINVYKKTFNIS